MRRLTVAHCSVEPANPHRPACQGGIVGSTWRSIQEAHSCWNSGALYLGVFRFILLSEPTEFLNQLEEVRARLGLACSADVTCVQRRGLF